MAARNTSIDGYELIIDNAQDWDNAVYVRWVFASTSQGVHVLATQNYVNSYVTSAISGAISSSY